MTMKAKYMWIRTFAIILLLLIPNPASANSRLKDISHIAGVRGNSLIGYGLVNCHLRMLNGLQDF